MNDLQYHLRDGVKVFGYRSAVRDGWMIMYAATAGMRCEWAFFPFFFQVPFDSMARAQFFEMHQEQVPVMRFSHVIRSLLKLVHYDAFSIADLLQPREL